MIFDNRINPKAISLPFNWCAEYVDGSIYTEYDLQTHKKNDFYLIQRNKVIRFGLFGQGMKFFFEGSGVFNLQGRRIEVYYEDEFGNTHPLTNNMFRKDLITYKEAYSDYTNRQGEHRSNLRSINFGYKTKYIKDDLELFFQPIVSLPFSSSVYMEVKLTSNKNLNGHLIFKSRGREVDRIYAPLEANVSGIMHWTVKG